MGLDVTDLSWLRFVCGNMYCIEVLADVVERLELRIDDTAKVSLDAQGTWRATYI